MLTALAIFLFQDVVRGFVAVCIEIRTNVADKVLAYFKNSYLGRFRLNTPRNNPIFLKELWNVSLH